LHGNRGWRGYVGGVFVWAFVILAQTGVGLGASEEMSLLDTQRRVLEQTLHRLEKKETRLQTLEAETKERSALIDHELHELEALWERQHLILGVIKHDFFASKDLYLINLRLQNRVESLLQKPRDEYHRFKHDQEWIGRVLHKTGEYQQQYGPEWQGGDADMVKALNRRIEGLEPRYERLLSHLEGEIQPVLAFQVFLKQRQEALEKTFQTDPVNLFLKRGQNGLSLETWAGPAAQLKEWGAQTTDYLQQIFVGYAHLWLKLAGTTLFLAAILFAAGLMFLKRTGRRLAEPVASSLLSSVGWFACGLGLILAVPATGMPQFSLQGAVIAFLFTRGFLILAFWLRSASPDKTMNARRPIEALWAVSISGILLAILNPPTLFFQGAWLVCLGLLGLSIGRSRSSLKGSASLIISIFVPTAVVLSLLGWAYGTIAMAMVLFLLLLNWQLAAGLDDWFRRPASGETAQVDEGVARRIGSAMGRTFVFVFLCLLSLPTALDYLGGPFFLNELAAYKIGSGHVSMELGKVFLVLISLATTKAIVGMANEAISIRHERPPTTDKGSTQALQTLSTYIIWFAFGLSVLYLIGFTSGNIAVITGGLSVGVGFGLQNIIHNFVGGIILLFSRPIKPGDLIDHEGKFCRVRKVSIRNTVVETFDGKTIFIPNSRLISKEFSNWNHKEKRMRLKVDVGVSYKADPAQVKETLLDIARSSEKVLQTPKPLVIFKEFGPSSLQFSLKFWIKGPGHLMAGSELRYRIYEVFKERGFEIAYPQIDVHLDGN